jgi:glycosyltransferase involved in cell wall biosynthesis
MWMPGRLLRAATRYLSPAFHARFCGKTYIGSKKGPHGWWKRFPKLHYSLFAEATERSFSPVRRIDSSKRTILFITHEMTRTGAPILLLNLMNRFKDRFNIAVISMEGGGLEGAFADLASWYDPPAESFWNREKILATRIRNMVASTDVSFAIVNTIVCSVAIPHLRKAGIPSIHLVHEFPVDKSSARGLKLSALYADATVFSSNLVKQDAIRKMPHIDNSKTHVIPQGIFDPSYESVCVAEDLAGGESVPDPRSGDKDSILVVGAGTVDYRKGVDLFLDCARKTVDRLPGKNIRFAWVGGGFHNDDKPYPRFVRDHVAKYDLGDRFVQVDEVKSIRSVCEQADIFLLPSRLDPLPIVAQTALACGLPLICFDKATGMAEYLREDPDADFGVCPYLDTEAASERIAALATDESLRRRVGQGGGRVASRFFTADGYLSQLEELAGSLESEGDRFRGECGFLQASGKLDGSYAYNGNIPSDPGITAHYLCTWRNRMHRRKPMPGFHPGIFQENHPGDGDPLVRYLKKGSPPGDWMERVLTPEGGGELLYPMTSALHIHAYYHQGVGDFLRRLRGSSLRPDLFVSVSSREAADIVTGELCKHPGWNAVIRVVPNRGRDIGPLLTEFSSELRRYEIIGHVHAKQTVHVPDRGAIDLWNTLLFENMLGGKHRMPDIIASAFSRDPSLGLVFPDDPHVIGWGRNLPYAEGLASRMGLLGPLPENINFPVGTMFWARTAAMAPLFDLGLKWEDYPEEPLPNDGTLLHAVERLIPRVVRSAGYRCAVTHIPGISR